jgi:hypothetical protein
MNPLDYNFLPAPLWLISLLHWVTLTAHFAAMNFVVGGIAIALWGKFTNRWGDPTVQRFIRLFPSAMAATVTLGVAPLLFLQLTYHRQVYASSILSGWFWLAIVPAVIVAYYLLYSAANRIDKQDLRAGGLLSVALVLLVYVSFAYSSIFSMAERPDDIKALYAAGQSGLTINPYVGDYIFRWLHMLLGALTVGGFFVGWIGRDNEPAFKTGKAFFLWGMVFAAVAGLAYIFTLGDYLLPYMRTPAVWLLLIGIVLSAGSLHFFFRRRFAVSAIMLGVSLLTMVINRHYVRAVKLQEYWDPAAMPVKPMWSVFLIFLVCFVAAVALLWYMTRLFQKGQGEPVA